MFTCLLICLGFFISLTQCQDCESGMLTDVLNCFRTVGVSTKRLSGQDADTILQEATYIDPNIMCTDKVKYKDAMNCTLTFLDSCLYSTDLDGMLPDIELFNQGVDYFCSNLDNFDVSCYTKNDLTLEQCTENVGTVVAESDTSYADLTPIENMCLSYDINYDCIKVHLTSCSKDTAKIDLNLVDTYFLPSACFGKKPSRVDRPSYTYLASDGSGRHSYYHCLVILVCIFCLLSMA